MQVIYQSYFLLFTLPVLAGDDCFV